MTTPAVVDQFLTAAGKRNLAALHRVIDWRLSSTSWLLRPVRYGDPRERFDRFMAETQKNDPRDYAAELAELADLVATPGWELRAAAEHERDKILAEFRVTEVPDRLSEQQKHIATSLAAAANSVTAVYVLATGEEVILPFVVASDGEHIGLPTKLIYVDEPMVEESTVRSLWPSPPLSSAPDPVPVLPSLARTAHDLAKAGSTTEFADLVDWKLSGMNGLIRRIGEARPFRRAKMAKNGLGYMAPGDNLMAERDVILTFRTMVEPPRPAGAEVREKVLELIRVPELPDGIGWWQRRTIEATVRRATAVGEVHQAPTNDGQILGFAIAPEGDRIVVPILAPRYLYHV